MQGRACMASQVCWESACSVMQGMHALPGMLGAGPAQAVLLQLHRGRVIVLASIDHMRTLKRL
jgi:hypothetical protein